ncbi:hypothetical protein [Vibrio sp. 10N.261.55.A7]|uniref:helix-turn-helix transcriptional regulator n=1 Tax=Vibrio sp. 10N.261.55.A7 TaxID=1880851 RepID=UPI000C84DC82|nr:hypothetical protein [Vibrio sp. 10N.261.55.A7]PMK03340.1 hypothetical protein BCU12_17390 [Vibrio sp. 10N.261.55.A7]
MSYSQDSNQSVSFSYTPPAFVATKQPSSQPAVYDAKKYYESSNTIMCHQEVLDFFSKKRTTIIAWRNHRGFPDPISKAPLRWIRAAVMEWVEHEGGFKGE